MTVGTAFDIKAEQKVLNQIRVSKQIEEREFEIELRNHKNEDVIIEVEKRLYGFWEVIESTLEYDKEDANTLIFKLPVKAESEAKVRFKVRFTTR